MGGGGVGQGGCERRSEVFVKIQNKKKFFFWGGGVGWVGWGGGGGGGGGGVRGGPIRGWGGEVARFGVGG